MRIHHAAVAALLVAAVPACSHKAQPGDVGPEKATVLTVENNGFLDVVVYVVRGGQRIRLGEARGHAMDTFVIPATLVQPGGTLRFLADPIGGRAQPTTEDIVVFPGDQLVLKIQR